MGGFRGGKGKGGKGGGRGKGKGKKKGKGRKDADWAHEGASNGFLDGPPAAATSDACGDDGDEGEPSRKRQRRMTQALQDQMRRGKQKAQARAKERAVGRKFEAARLAQEALWAPPPPGKPRRHRHRGKRRLTPEEAARLPEAVRNQMRYRWIHQAGAEPQAEQQEGGERLEEVEAEAAVPRRPAAGNQGDGSAYAALMAELSARGRESKYRELLEQRRREQEGWSEEDGSSDDEEGEDEGSSDEEEDDGLEGLEEEEEADEDAAALEMEEEESGGSSASKGASSEEEEASSAEEGDGSDGSDGSGDDGEEPAEEDAQGLAGGGAEDEEDDDDADRTDAFVAQWLKPPLAPEEVRALDAEGGGSGRARTVATWQGPEVGEAEDEDPLLVQALGGGSVEPVAGLGLGPQDPVASPQVRKALRESWAALVAGPEGEEAWADPRLAGRLFPVLNSYRDLLFAGLTEANLATAERVTWLHVLNHTLKARARVLRHNLRRRREAKAARAARVAAAVGRELGEGEEGDSSSEGSSSSGERDGREGGNGPAAASSLVDAEEPDRDQGYTRPRVLVLLPMRCQALAAIKEMLELLGPKTSVSGLARLEEAYGAAEPGDGEDSSAEEELRREAEGRKRKPEDWQRLFAGNCDDDFKLGLALTPGQGKGKGAGKGVAVKLFAEFYSSDIIVASPLGLRLAIEGQNGGDADFLSSVELLVLAQADALYMQNWDHVAEVLRLLNRAPKRDHNTDFARVRSYVLEGQAGRFRQTLLYTRFLDPLFQAALGRACRNHRGRLRVTRAVEQGASICQVALKVKQVFQRVPCPSPAAQGDARFAYFTRKVLPELQRLRQGHTLVFVPSYYDFVRLRNHAVRAELSHVCVSEYERPTETSRGRARFFHGQRDLMFYTGRAHFFKRYRMRGAHHLVFYGLPELPHFYPEMVNLLEEATGAGAGSGGGGGGDKGASTRVTSCFVMFTRYEALALERVVGAARAKHMLESEKATFLFC